MLRVVRREAAEPDRRERVAHGVEPGHAAQAQRDDAGDGDERIHQPQVSWRSRVMRGVRRSSFTGPGACPL